MEHNKRIRQENLLESVLEVTSILKQGRPDLSAVLAILFRAETLLKKESLTDDDLAWIDENIVRYLCHVKCLYDLCPLERLNGETDRARWQRWGEIVDQIKNRAVLLCKSAKKRGKHSSKHI